MAEKIDLKDKKLIYYLSENARTSYTQLAKKVSLSKNAVKYRISKLKNQGIITNFASVVNLGAIGYDTFTILIRFNQDIYKDKEIIDYFQNHDFANWAVVLSGDWDLFVEFVIKNHYQMQELIHEITEKFSDRVNTFQTFFSSEPLKVEHLIPDFYKDLELNEPLKKPRVSKKQKIDATDKKILAELNKDSSLNYLEISERLKLSLDIVRYRIKNLVKNGIIIKFFSELNLEKLGYTEYLYTLKLRNISNEKLTTIKNRIIQNKNIKYAFFDILSSSIIFNCAFSSAEGIDSLSRGLRNEFPDIIEKQDYLIIKEQILFNLFPRGLVS